MEKQYRNKILTFFRRNKRMPNISEVMTLCGFASRSSAFYVVAQLVKEGVVEKDSSGKLIPKKIHSDISLLGVVEAGFPSAAEEELIDTMSLDEYLIKNKEATFMLLVKGDSMIDAGILEGDMVLVERGKQPKVGQIVIAQVDGAYTMKYLRKRGDKMYLEPANKKYKPIFPENELKIEAVVQAVIRKY